MKTKHVVGLAALAYLGYGAYRAYSGGAVTPGLIADTVLLWPAQIAMGKASVLFS